MNRFEQEYYQNIALIARSVEKIAKVLEASLEFETEKNKHFADRKR